MIDDPSRFEPPHYVPPREGIHVSLFKFSCECARESLSQEETLQLIEKGLQLHPARRDPDDREINCAIKDAFAAVHGGEPKEEEPHPIVESYCKETAEDVFYRRQLTESDLAQRSPQQTPKTPTEALGELFEDHELVNLATGPKRSFTRSVLEWKQRGDLSQYSLMVPHPMSARRGITKDGRPHRPRTTSNTGPRRWVVTEYDLPPIEWQPSLIAELSELAQQPPSVVLWSGNKSLQVWFLIGDNDAATVAAFENEAAKLGADPLVMGDPRRCQLVRTPMALRDNGNVQRVIFWNPEMKGDIVI